MNLNHIINAWRDEEYRESLDSETRALLPENPASEIDLTEADLAEVDGGTLSNTLTPGSAFSVVTSTLDCASNVATYYFYCETP